VIIKDATLSGIRLDAEIDASHANAPVAAAIGKLKFTIYNPTAKISRKVLSVFL
jgi:hypothetical protein